MHMWMKVDEKYSLRQHSFIGSDVYPSGPLPKGALPIGKGRLDWNAEERRTDRYGYVFLTTDGDEYMGVEPMPITIPKRFVGWHGTLVAKIVEVHRSDHAGDLFHKVFVRMPEVGMNIPLGTGTLDYLDDKTSVPPIVTIGIKPDDGRAEQWLSIRALYDSHMQGIELYFVPTPES